MYGTSGEWNIQANEKQNKTERQRIDARRNSKKKRQMKIEMCKMSFHFWQAFNFDVDKQS